GNDTLQVISPAALPLTEPVTINGGPGNDNMTGGHGKDTMRGQDGNDVRNGGAGNDKMDGGSGGNPLNGGDGSDSMTAGTGTDSFDGGSGVDTVSYASRTAPLTITLDNVANDGQVIRVIPLPLVFENDNVRETVENVGGGPGHAVTTAAAG